MLLDIRMPKIDGIEVLRRIKNDDKLRGIKVIMFTTSEDQEQAELCYDLGCNAHVIKPPGEILLKAIAKIGQRI